MSYAEAIEHLLSLCLAALLAPAYAQAPTKPSEPLQTAAAKSETDQLVDQLIENAAQNRAALPSLTAHETIASKQDDVVFFAKNSDKAEATVRLVRKSPDNPDFEEIRTITTFNNKPVPPDQHPNLHFNLGNDFDDVPSFAFSPQHRGCFSFALAPHPNPETPLSISIAPRPDAFPMPECRIAKRGFTGTATIDPKSHQITRLEYTESNGTPAPQFTGSIDYAPAKVGNKIFWLPTTVDAQLTPGKHRWEWHSRYSDYHQYTSSIKLLPDTTHPDPQSER